MLFHTAFQNHLVTYNHNGYGASYCKKLPDIQIPDTNKAAAEELMYINSFLCDIMFYWIPIIKNKNVPIEILNKNIKEQLFSFALFYQPSQKSSASY